MKILFIHGVGHAEQDASWWQPWHTEVEKNIRGWNVGAVVESFHSAYDDLFRQSALPALPVALIRGLLSGFEHAVIDKIVDFFRGGRGLADIPDELHWHVGMVALWLGDDQLREQVRRRVEQDIRSARPDVIIAHSLGSLISYDAISQNQDLVAARTYVTLGSQIGNPFVLNQWAGGRVVGLPGARQWYHLFNPHDPVLTAGINRSDDNFMQIDATSTVEGLDAHDALLYFQNPNVRQTVWMALAGSQGKDLTPDAGISAKGAWLAEETARVIIGSRRAKRRALLVGINEYRDPASKLDGCLNDVFLMSSVLQERGFDPEDIRVVLNDRADAKGIRDRLAWLLEGVRDGDDRVFYYSGHGARMPIYGPDRRIERIDECLVPYDFQWSSETAVTDKDFFGLYSQLPYKSRFVAILDCCHAGGMTRGASPKVRGLDIPDDIRHRMIRWDAPREMWVDRELATPNPDMASASSGRDYLGQNGATYRLGRAVNLRGSSNKDYDDARKRMNHLGPYLPVLFEACGEVEKAYEYRHGVTSYGAFTYSLVTILRRVQRKKPISFRELHRLTAKQLKALDYPQTPCLLGPGNWLGGSLP